MRSAPSPVGDPRVRLSRTLPRAAALLVLVASVGLLALPAAHASAWSATGSYVWGNGAVTCIFNASSPTVTVAASDRNGTGMGIGLTQLDELTPAGTTVASAVIGAVPWDPVNQSTGQWLAMNYTATVPVTSAAPPSHAVGSVQITLVLSLIRNLSDPTAHQVTYALSINGWPWQASQDTLAVVVPLWSAFATSEHLVTGAGASATVDSVSTSSGQTLEYFVAGSSANATSGAPIPVSTRTTLMAGKAATTLTFGTGVGGASALSYEATLGISPSTPVLGIPLYDYAAVAGGAGLVALVVGVGTRRIRRRPSDLTFVEESE